MIVDYSRYSSCEVLLDVLTNSYSKILQKFFVE